MHALLHLQGWRCEQNIYPLLSCLFLVAFVRILKVRSRLSGYHNGVDSVRTHREPKQVTQDTGNSVFLNSRCGLMVCIILPQERKYTHTRIDIIGPTLILLQFKHGRNAGSWTSWAFRVIGDRGWPNTIISGIDLHVHSRTCYR